MQLFDEEMLANFEYILSKNYNDAEKIDLTGVGGIYITVGELRLLLRAAFALKKDLSLQRRVRELTKDIQAQILESSREATALMHEINALRAAIVADIEQLVQIGIKYREDKKHRFIQLLDFFATAFEAYTERIEAYSYGEMRIMVENARDVLSKGDITAIATRLKRLLEMNYEYVAFLKELKMRISELKEAFGRLLDECKKESSE